MKKLLSILLVVGLLYAAAEAFAASMVEEAIEEQVESADMRTTHVSADVESFPLVAKALAQGLIERVTVTLLGVVRSGVVIDRVQVRMDDLRVRRSALLEGDVRPIGLGRGTISAGLSLAAVARAAGVRPFDAPAGISVAVSGGTLSLSAPGLPGLSISFPLDLLPCDASGRVKGDRILLRCTVREIPAFLERPFPLF